MEEIKEAVRELVEREEARLLEKVRKGSKHVVFDFKEIISESPVLADFLLDNPEQAMKLLENEIKNVHEPKNRLVPRFQNISKIANIPIRRLVAEHIYLNKLVVISGIVRSKSPPKPQVKLLTFECLSCGIKIPVLQKDEKIVKKPFNCSCGNKHTRLVDKEFVDAYSLSIEEDPGEIEGDTELRKIQVFCKEGLCDEDIEPRISAGTRVDIVGIYKETFKTKGKTKFTELDIYIDANYIKIYDEDYTAIVIKDSDKKQIKELSKKPELLELLKKSIFTGISGYDKEKEAMILQQFGGTKKSTSKGLIRGDIHILNIGDPAMAKSQMLKRIQNISPKARYSTGAGSSGVGLTASAIKDELLGGFTCAAGTIPLAHKGIAIIDEFDKMNEEDREKIHEVMEQQTVSVDKANIHATLKAETALLTAANPEKGKFDPFRDIYSQFKLPPTLVSRFDFIFTFVDKPDAKKDKMIASMMLSDEDEVETKEELSKELIKKYISYARKTFQPKLNKEAKEYLEEKYVELRSRNVGKENAGLPITARQLGALRRVTEAYAKLYLKEEAGVEEAEKAWDLVYYNIKTIAFDKESGTLDINIINLGASNSQRNRMIVFLNVFDELALVSKQVHYEDILQALTERAWKPTEVDSVMERLIRSGDLYEPRTKVIQRM